jgi:hypothetical protein
VNWRIVGNRLERTETLTADKDLKINSWWVAVPTTGHRSSVEMSANLRTDIFEGRDGTLKVTAMADWPIVTSLQATGDTKRSKGPIGSIPLHLIYAARNIELKKNRRATWKLTLEVAKRERSPRENL